ncbi:MAG: Grx4 family monothiol glutaredoxin [Candidatus Eiseniibacteriota bacterium]
MSNPIVEQIKKDVSEHDVILYMKGTPDFPQCGFSSVVVQVLGHLNVPYVAVDVLQNPAVRQGIKEFSNWPTIPQLYVKGELVGGCDIVREMFQTGELTQLLQDKGIPVAA